LSGAPGYEYRHVVAFEETNLVGNVYYVNPLRWQGRCREMFLRDHAPTILAEMAHGLALVTTRCSCEFFAELNAFDEVIVRMHLAGLQQNRIAMRFEYVRRTSGSEGTREDVVARGEQEVACMRREGGRMVPVPVPAVLRDALRPFEA
jgi:enediyne biosynthesis thioesterase